MNFGRFTVFGALALSLVGTSVGQELPRYRYSTYDGILKFVSSNRDLVIDTSYGDRKIVRANGSQISIPYESAPVAFEEAGRGWTVAGSSILNDHLFGQSSWNSQGAPPFPIPDRTLLATAQSHTTYAGKRYTGASGTDIYDRGDFGIWNDGVFQSLAAFGSYYSEGSSSTWGLACQPRMRGGYFVGTESMEEGHSHGTTSTFRLAEQSKLLKIDGTTINLQDGYNLTDTEQPGVVGSHVVDVNSYGISIGENYPDQSKNYIWDATGNILLRLGSFRPRLISDAGTIIGFSEGNLAFRSATGQIASISSLLQGQTMPTEVSLQDCSFDNNERFVMWKTTNNIWRSYLFEPVPEPTGRVATGVLVTLFGFRKRHSVKV